MGKSATISLFLILAVLLLPQGLAAQDLAAQDRRPIFSPPDQVVERIMKAQALACQVADTASGGVLDLLDRTLQQMIQEQEDLVRRAAADSAPGLAAEETLRESEARLKPLEDELNPLLVRWNEINGSQKSYEDSVSTARQGDAPPGTKTRLEQLDEEIKASNEVYARDSLELSKIADHWLEGRDEQLKAQMEENRTKWKRAMDERADIMRRVETAQENPNYKSLVSEEAALDIQIAELKAKIKPLSEAIAAAKETLANVNLENIKKLEQLHEINGFTHQYLTNAKDCVQKRRTQLAGAPPAPPTAAQPGQTPFTGGFATGRWDATCSGNLPPDSARTDGGEFNAYFDETGDGVRVSFITSGKVIGIDYGARGRVLADGTVKEGSGGASFYSLVWDGRFTPAPTAYGILTGSGRVTGSGTVTVSNLFSTGGPSCTGTWTATP